MTALDAKWGPTNTGIHFQDSKTGTTFDRPGFQAMLDFCRANLRKPYESQGVIEIYDMSRFGRILTEGDEDPEAVLSMMKTFLKLGWEVRFSTFENTGNRVMDFFQTGLYAIMAAETSKKLQRDVRRGRQHFLTLDTGARWMGGRPPFGTVRIDPATDRVLERRERVINRGGTILAANPEEIEIWNEVAKMLLAGRSYGHLIEFLNEKKARVEWGQAWTSKSVKWILTNPALIGEMHINHRDPKTGTVNKKVYKAEWPALVDEALFQAVCAEVTRRQGDGHRPHQSRRNMFVPICAHCGCPYYYQERVKNKRVDRFFVHPYGKAGINPDWKERIASAGCRNWSVSAPIIERALLDLIIERRTSEDFAVHLAEIMADRDDLEGSAKKRREAVDRKLSAIQAQQRRTVANMTTAQLKGLDDAIFWQQLAELNQQIEEAKTEKKLALELEHAANTAWDDVQDLINETRNIESIWASGDLHKRQEILNWWVRELHIVVDKLPVLPNGKADPKYMVAFLRTAPTEALERAITHTHPQKSDSTAGRPLLFQGMSRAFFTPLPHRHTKAAWVLADSENVEHVLTTSVRQ